LCHELLYDDTPASGKIQCLCRRNRAIGLEKRQDQGNSAIIMRGSNEMRNYYACIARYVPLTILIYQKRMKRRQAEQGADITAL
jgi:hypothetical protein